MTPMMQHLRLTGPRSTHFVKTLAWSTLTVAAPSLYHDMPNADRTAVARNSTASATVLCGSAAASAAAALRSDTVTGNRDERARQAHHPF